MSTYLINHLRIPGGVPTEESLRYLEQVQATTEAYGAKWLVLDAEVRGPRGQLARFGRADRVPGRGDRQDLVQLARVPGDPVAARRSHHQRPGPGGLRRPGLHGGRLRA